MPIITAFAAIAISVLMSFVYPPFDAGLTNLGEWVTDNAVLGGFVYGTLNRLLIPLGLHHILNNPLWFLFGAYTTAGGDGGERRHRRASSQGDPTAGAFMTGFFPIMMFALPGRRPGDLARAAKPSAEEGRRRHHALRRADCRSSPVSPSRSSSRSCSWRGRCTSSTRC